MSNPAVERRPRPIGRSSNRPMLHQIGVQVVHLLPIVSFTPNEVFPQKRCCHTCRTIWQYGAVSGVLSKIAATASARDVALGSIASDWRNKRHPPAGTNCMEMIRARHPIDFKWRRLPNRDDGFAQSQTNDRADQDRLTPLRYDSEEASAHRLSRTTRQRNAYEGRTDVR